MSAEPWRDYPPMTDHTAAAEPVPRRIRGVLAGEVVFDTVAATYVWDSVRYPAYHVPLSDVVASYLIDESHPQQLRRGTAHRHALHVHDVERPGAARVYRDDAAPGIAGTVRFEWEALDAWYEEDEQVFVHPRNPYTRVDALRSSRSVRVGLDGVVLAESAAPVLVFETGLPTRYYLDPLTVDMSRLVTSTTVTSCPYKGRTTGYWSVDTGSARYPDLAWSYDFPTRQLLPISGLIAFLNEKVDITVDGRELERPVTPFS